MKVGTKDRPREWPVGSWRLRPEWSVERHCQVGIAGELGELGHERTECSEFSVALVIHRVEHVGKSAHDFLMVLFLARDCALFVVVEAIVERVAEVVFGREALEDFNEIVSGQGLGHRFAVNEEDLCPEWSVQRYGQVGIASALGELPDAALELDQALALPEQVFNARQALRVVGERRVDRVETVLDGFEPLVDVGFECRDDVIEVFECEGLRHEDEVNE